MIFPGEVAEAFPVRASYVPSSATEIAALWTHYGSIPGGITLEGKADGLPRIRSLRYDARQNEFFLNGNLRYPCPVSAEKLREIALAIKREDSLGFTFQTKDTVYGALNSRGHIVADLKKADLYLGTRVFNPENVSCPKKATPGIRNSPRGDSVHFRFGNYRFIQEKGRLCVAGSQVRIALIPILRRTDARGNFLPDFQTIERVPNRMSYASQVRKLTENFSEALNCKAVERTVRYGEVAAFLRALKSQELDLSQLFSPAGQAA
jgi:hypothetical protein